MHGKLLEGGLGRKRKWRVSGSSIFLAERLGGFVSLGLRSGGCRKKEKKTKKKKRKGEQEVDRRK